MRRLFPFPVRLEDGVEEEAAQGGRTPPSPPPPNGRMSETFSK